MNVEVIFNEVKKHYKNENTFLVGIDGLGGAGKSTIAKEINELFEADNIHTEVFHLDDFIYPRKIRYNDDYPQWEQYYYLQWKYDYFLNTVVNPVRENRVVPSIELYDKKNDKYFTVNRNIPKGSIVIIEGIFLQREELKNIFDYVIYVDVPEEERLRRVLLRDVHLGDEIAIRNKYENRYFPAEHFYVKKYNPAARANLVV